MGHGILDVKATLQAAEGGVRPALEPPTDCYLFPGAWGTGDGTFVGCTYAANGGGYGGTGFLLNLGGNSTYTSTPACDDPNRPLLPVGPTAARSSAPGSSWTATVTTPTRL